MRADRRAERNGKCPTSAAILTDSVNSTERKKQKNLELQQEEPQPGGLGARQSKRLFKCGKSNNKVIEFIISDSVAEDLIRLDSCYSACFSLVHLTLHSCSAGAVNGNCQYWFRTSSIWGRTAEERRLELALRWVKRTGVWKCKIID